MDSGPSDKQSEENYAGLGPKIKADLEGGNVYLKVTSVILCDEFLRLELINDSVHKRKIKECLTRDKEEEKESLFWSMLISALITAYFMVYFVPSDKYYILKFLGCIYIATICYIGFLFRTKQD
jgi:hypothetical protein